MKIETRVWRTDRRRFDYRIDGGEWIKLPLGWLVCVDGRWAGQRVSRTELCHTLGWTPRQVRYHSRQGMFSFNSPMQRGQNPYELWKQQLAKDFWPGESTGQMKRRQIRQKREMDAIAAAEEAMGTLAQRRERKRIKEEAEARVVAKDVGCPLLTQFASMRFAHENAGAGRS